MSEEAQGPLSRRGLMLGAGAAAAVLGSALTGAQPAAAEPGDGKTAAGDPKNPSVLASPVTSSLGSAPQHGFTYKTVSMFDFTAEFASAQRAWGGYGTYTANAASPLWASVEIPAGSLIRDIEWYVRNSSANPVTALGRLWVAGSGSLTATVADVSIAVSTSITRTRVVVPAASYGPYPLSTRLNLGISTPSDGTIQINGCRVGFSQGGAQLGLLPTPIRVYDSRSGAKFAAGETRTITLPSTLIQPGVAGIKANVIATATEASGHLKVFSAASALPSSSSVNYATADTIVNELTTTVSAARQIKVYSSKKAHVVIDVTATIS
ncbi:hypothetical protein [Microlunatus parietis]|uniref:Uncharacterized protein n=1 Tax=Microlunatus parietis TaxID=682979 RepID=A0A7Y9IES3_9ACTN|nr:hypothetical protein [Microlunatus parietis]NYE75504.1 hypothetical protein [Microlunatus parietis]